MDTVRVLRILEYTGPRDVVERTLQKGSVPMNGEHTINGFTIRSKVLGEFPEIMETGNAQRT